MWCFQKRRYPIYAVLCLSLAILIGAPQPNADDNGNNRITAVGVAVSK